jgi:hypothetical protein
MYDDCTEIVGLKDLTQSTSLDDYFQRDLELVRKGHIKREDIAQRRAILEGIEASGGQWWEWVHGNVPQMQSGGLALVREGRIVWATMTWIS